MTIRSTVKRFTVLRGLVTFGRTLRDQFGFNLGAVRGLRALWGFWREYRSYRRLAEANPCFSVSLDHLLPCLLDRTSETPVEPVYFVQDTWFAGRIAKQRPVHHYDVGSSAKTMALVAQFFPVTMVDIRPLPVEALGFDFVRGSILQLPFGDDSISSLSSLCVVEHIGLGRYGDEVDARGSEKAVMELRRVLAPRGDLYISIPVDTECRVYFNAHRAFTRDYLMELFHGMDLVAEQYLYGYDVVSRFDAVRGFGTGMYHFRKS